MPLHAFHPAIRRRAIRAALLSPVLFVGVARANEIGVVAGQTWTRHEVVGLQFQSGGSTDVVGTGRCFTIALPFTHPLGGAWSLAVVPTHYHLEYSGPAVSSAELPVLLRWTARSAWSPYAEVGGGIHLGAGLSPGSERRAEITPCLDAGVGIVHGAGQRRFTLAARAVSAPHLGEWGRRISLLAGVTQSVARGDAPPAPPDTRRRGGLIEPQLGRVPRPRVAMWIGYSHVVPSVPVEGDVLYRGADSVAAGHVRDDPGDGRGPVVGLSIDLSGPSIVSLRVAPAVTTRRVDHTITVDGASIVGWDERVTVLSVPVQLRIAPPHATSGPYLLIGPTLSGTVGRREPEYQVQTSVVPAPGPGGTVLDVSVGDILDPTVGLQVRALGRLVGAEIRSLGTFTNGRRDTFSLLLGIDLTAPPR